VQIQYYAAFAALRPRKLLPCDKGECRQSLVPELHFNRDNVKFVF